MKTSQMILTDQKVENILDGFSTWLAENGKRGQGHSEKSISAHLSDTKLFIRWHENETAETFYPALLVSQDFRNYFHFSINTECVSPATWNRRRASLSLFCSFAVETGYLAYNPFTGVPVMQKQVEAPLSLAKSDYFKFMRKVEQAPNLATTETKKRKAIRNRAMVALMIFGGLRVDELCELRYSELLMSDRKGRVTIVDGKGHKRGEVPLGREARIALQEWQKQNESSKGGSLFGGISPRQVERIVKEIGREAGIDDVHPHSLRHTFIYNVLQQTGGDLEKAKSLARHNRIDQTVRYGLPHREDLEQAVEYL